MNRREAKREAQRAQSNREELLERMARALPEDGRLEAFDGLTLGRLSKPMESVHALYQPAFCLIAQGSKRVLLGEEVYRYDPAASHGLSGACASITTSRSRSRRSRASAG